MKHLAYLALTSALFATPADAQFGTALPVALERWAAVPAPESPLTSYLHDDGSTENAMNMQNGGQIAWLQRFDAIGGADVITSVSVVYGTAQPGGPYSPPAGSPTNVVVWNDTDNDGDPTTGLVLVSQTATTIATPDLDLFQKTPVNPAPVSGVFFVGAYTNNAVGQFPAGTDWDVAASGGRAWISGSNAVNGFNPNNINSGGHVGVFEMDALGFPSVWLLRAEGIGTPSTFCTAKVTFCGAPGIIGSGIPSASSGTGFIVAAQPARSCRSGILVYNTATGVPLPFEGGTLCVNPMGLRRAGSTNSGGTPGPNCDGSFRIDMNAFAKALWVVPDCAGAPSGIPPNNPAGFLMNPGTDVFAQYWGRDTPGVSFVSGGLTWTIGP